MNRNNLVAALAVLTTLSAGCATTNLRYTDACTLINDPEAPAGFTVYSCPHRFPKPVGASTKDEHRGAREGGIEEFAGLTDCANKTVYYYETYPEIRFHEYNHDRVCP